MVWLVAPRHLHLRGHQAYCDGGRGARSDVDQRTGATDQGQGALRGATLTARASLAAGVEQVQLQVKGMPGTTRPGRRVPVTARIGRAAPLPPTSMPMVTSFE
ncbi:MAG: hypothetical protein IPL60_11605 [Ardenticatenia bacterium]|nr:hypothetical protein [Ardenticatenia bacterium]